MKIGVLASGTLGLTVLNHLYNNYEVVFVMTNKNSMEIIDFCNENRISVFIGNPRAGSCKNFIKNIVIDILISVNYLFIIEKELINLPKKISFNIHGSLLPKYRGRTPHVWAIINGEKQTGVTAHIIDEGCDTGDIIEQVVIPIDDNDTGADILNKYSHQYIPLITSIITKIKKQDIRLTKQNHSQSSFFSKRTSIEGKIDWNWQKERIRNWVRAQAYPYPGAFSFFNEEKVIIDKVEFDNSGFLNEMPNGLILSISPLLVKTPNGVLCLSVIRNQNIMFEIGKIFE